MIDSPTTGLTADPAALLDQAHQQVRQLQAEIQRTVIGQNSVVEQVLVALLARGHVLIEGVPGLGKTLLVRTLAGSFGGRFARIQFTPDLMPSDVTGHAMFNMKTQEFEIRPGPAFTNLLLADEINRAPAKTQAALLEVMQEGQITIEGASYPVDTPFMVLATQNPIEQEGTYPLPEAELDRFMLKVLIRYPAQRDEESMLLQMCSAGLGAAGLGSAGLGAAGLGSAGPGSAGLDAAGPGAARSGAAGSSLTGSTATGPGNPAVNPSAGAPRPLLTSGEVLALQRITQQITVDPAIVEYIVRIARATRDWPGVSRGAGPRASIALLNAARAYALIHNSSFVTPDDVKAVALPALRHRLLLAAELEIEGVPVDQVLTDICQSIGAPRQ